MDLDGTISTAVAIFNKKEDYNDIVTMGLPLSNDGKPVPSQAINACGLIPKGAKNVEVAKDFLKYFIQPKVNSEWRSEERRVGKERRRGWGGGGRRKKEERI